MLTRFYLLVLLPPVFFREPLPCEAESAFLLEILFAEARLPVDPSEAAEPTDDALPVLPNMEPEPVPNDPA